MSRSVTAALVYSLSTFGFLTNCLTKAASFFVTRATAPVARVERIRSIGLLERYVAVLLEALLSSGTVGPPHDSNKCHDERDNDDLVNDGIHKLPPPALCAEDGLFSLFWLFILMLRHTCAV